MHIEVRLVYKEIEDNELSGRLDEGKLRVLFYFGVIEI